MEEEMKDVRKQIGKNLLDLKVLPPVEKEDSELNILVDMIRYKIMGGIRIKEEKELQLLTEHPEVFLVDDSQYRLTKCNNLRFEVHVGNNPIARFYSQKRGVEYVLFLMELI
jgi:hypothetical protein